MSAVTARELACHTAVDEALPVSARAAEVERLPVIALVGRPNVGKSTFFARATGKYAEAANLPGTTVGVAQRLVRVDGGAAILVDLPGALSLNDGSAGLPDFWRLLAQAKPDAILAIIDMGDLARHLPLVLACRDLGLPLVVAANLADDADRRGIDVDLGRLSQLLAVPVVRTIGRDGTGIAASLSAALRLALGHVRGGDAAHRTQPAPPYPAAAVRQVSTLAKNLEGDLADLVRSGRLTPIGAASLAASATLEPLRWDVAERWAAQVERRRNLPPPLTDRMARAITAPWPGLPLFGAVTLGVLGATMMIGSWLATLMGNAWSAYVSPLMNGAAALVPVPALGKALLWTFDSGLLSMLAVGIPFVLTFYVILAVLEDSGYLAATAVLTDRLFNAVGLPGRAAIPVLAATGCNVPAIYGTRVLESRRERLIASFLIVLTPCSARSAVVVAALAPFAGPVVALAAFGVVLVTTIAAGVAANALVPGRQSPLVLELPPLRRPILRQVGAKAWFRFRSFLRTATPVMLAGSFVLGLAYETGAITPVENVIGPAFQWLLGLPAVAGIALVLAFLRKELALQLLLVLAIAELGQGVTSLGSFMNNGQLFVYAIATAVSIPCAATLATLVDEFGRRTAFVVSGATLAVGLGAAAIAARVVGIA